MLDTSLTLTFFALFVPQHFLLPALAAPRHYEAGSTVTWLSPSHDAIFAPGDVLNVTWLAPGAIVSPSFTLCTDAAASPASNLTSIVARSQYSSPPEDPASDTASDEPIAEPVPESSEECGGTVWPTVHPGTDGSYNIRLSVPLLASSGLFYLNMKSDLGDVYKSPPFTLQPASVTQTTSMGAASSTVLIISTAMSTPSITSSSSIATSFTASAAPQPIGPLTPPFSPGSVPSSASLPTPTVDTMATDSKSNTTAALAIPLSVIAVASLAGVALCYFLKRRRKRKEEKERALEQSKPQSEQPVLEAKVLNPVSRSSTASGDTQLEKVMSVIADPGVVPRRTPLPPLPLPPSTVSVPVAAAAPTVVAPSSFAPPLPRPIHVPPPQPQPLVYGMGSMDYRIPRQPIYQNPPLAMPSQWQAPVAPINHSSGPMYSTAPSTGVYPYRLNTHLQEYRHRPPLVRTITPAVMPTLDTVPLLRSPPSFMAPPSFYPSQYFHHSQPAPPMASPPPTHLSSATATNYFPPLPTPPAALRPALGVESLHREAVAQHPVPAVQGPQSYTGSEHEDSATHTILGAYMQFSPSPGVPGAPTINYNTRPAA